MRLFNASNGHFELKLPSVMGAYLRKEQGRYDCSSELTTPPSCGNGTSPVTQLLDDEG
jgi:hypothetical protein